LRQREVDELLMGVLRREWPFLASYADTAGHQRGRLRPCMMYFLGQELASGGVLKGRECVLTAAALELAAIASLAFDGVVERSDEDAPTGQNWANKFAVMLGDLLLAHANELMARCSEATASRFATELSASSALRFTMQREMPEAMVQERAAVSARPAFEVPCSFGAWQAGARRRDLDAISVYANRLGASYLIADSTTALDVLLDNRGTRNEAGVAAKADPEVASATAEALAAEALDSIARLAPTHATMKAAALAATFQAAARL
jgi:geranylgeranyl pyrophosphate synthase